MATATTLNADQRGALDATLNLIIPPSDDGRMPGAAEYDVLAYMLEFAPHALPGLIAQLDAIDKAAQSRFHAPFSSLGQSEAQSIIDELRGADAQFMAELARQTVSCYYQQDQVVQAIGMPVRAPFPQGYEVERGDFSLLDPVRARGPVYRDVVDN